MMQLLILRLDAPLVAFGAPIIDNLGKVQAYPALSMLVGLLGNALGYDHADHKRLQRLQQRIRYAARCDRPGQLLRDFQTVDLGASYMADDTAWTTRSYVEKRRGGEASDGTHIRHRDYRADSVHTVALGVVPAAETPSLDVIETALRCPERPLFIGRKCCLPSLPLLAGRTEAETPIAALRAWPRVHASRTSVGIDEPISAWWADGEGDGEADDKTRVLAVTDERDWLNQLHGGQRLVRHGLINPPRGAP